MYIDSYPGHRNTYGVGAAGTGRSESVRKFSCQIKIKHKCAQLGMQ